MIKITTEKNNRKKLESGWDHGFFVGMNPCITDFFLSGDDFYSCATIRRLKEDKAFDASVITETNMKYRDYILEGARSTPTEVRLPSASVPLQIQRQRAQFQEGPNSTMANSCAMDTVLAHLKKVIRAAEYRVVFLCSVSHNRNLCETAVKFCGIETLVFVLIGFLIMG